jgi:UDP-N-acetylmuramoyl-tripeptide--D-alanyl-D-alanine ligase
MKLTLSEAAMGAGAVLEAPASMTNAGALMARGYSIDSRTVGEGELFFAVKGERLDGHDFVAGAVGRGAVGAVVARARVVSLPDAVLAAPLLIVEDPLLALQSLATHVRRHWGKRVVAVTGSAGKTTTKEADCSSVGRGIERAEVDGEFEQRLWASVATDAAGTGARDGGGGDGHEPRG